MLRDLDQRQVPDDNGAITPGATPLRSGTASVAGVLIPTGASRNSSPLVSIVIAVAGLAVFGGAGWWWTHQVPAIKVVQTEPVSQSTPIVAAPVQVSPVSAPIATPVAVPTATLASSPVIALAPVANASVAKVVATPSIAPVAVAVAVSTSPALAASAAAMPLAVAAAPTLVRSTVKPAPATVNNSPLTSVSVAAVSVTVPPAAAPAAVVTASTPKSVPVTDSASTGQRQQQAAREALAQAQTLWNAGAHDNAIDLLQQAVATAERSAQSAPGVPTTLALASLARELARMQVAQGRPVASVDMLTRLEPLLSGDPELWAVRANAAQRAGRHQDSVNAYTVALQSRPNEQRWLLGAAVSSAALGQTANATALAERAASVGPLPKDVQAYLRQMGVTLKE
jgi:Flp pilus assembly protein TadD